MNVELHPEIVVGGMRQDLFNGVRPKLVEPLQGLVALPRAAFIEDAAIEIAHAAEDGLRTETRRTGTTEHVAQARTGRAAKGTNVAIAPRL